ncbi:MAG: thioredoxin family protein [Chloroflexi bacterium]|nr:thioredoxin family protein [Chloroflexota bacterium]
MGEFINNNSVWILAILLCGVAASFAWQHRHSWRSLAVIAFVLVVLTSGYLTSRHGASDVASIAEVDAVLASGAPVVLELYSDTCTLCIVSQRSVDGMERDLEGYATVLRVSIDEDVGRAVARRYGLGVLPTFMVFTAAGRERYRESGMPDIDRLEEEALAPS